MTFFKTFVKSTASSESLSLSESELDSFFPAAGLVAALAIGVDFDGAGFFSSSLSESSLELSFLTVYCSTNRLGMFYNIFKIICFQNNLLFSVQMLVLSQF